MRTPVRPTAKQLATKRRSREARRVKIALRRSESISPGAPRKEKGPHQGTFFRWAAIRVAFGTLSGK